MTSINDKLIQLAETKSGIREAIIQKGIDVDAELPFRDYIDKIKEISGGSDKNFGLWLPRSQLDRVTDNNVIEVRGSNTGGISQKISTKSLTNDGDFFSLTARFKIDSIYGSLPNLILGLDNALGVGFSNSSQYFGIWQNDLSGDFNTGKSSLPLELDKWYTLKVTNTKTSSGCNVLLDVKYDNEENYINVFNKTISTLPAAFNVISVGECFYANSYWYTSSHIDMASVKLETNISD